VKELPAMVFRQSMAPSGRHGGGVLLVLSHAPQTRSGAKHCGIAIGQRFPVEQRMHFVPVTKGALEQTRVWHSTSAPQSEVSAFGGPQTPPPQ
jgi:hypothetical protein